MYTYIIVLLCNYVMSFVVFVFYNMSLFVLFAVVCNVHIRDMDGWNNLSPQYSRQCHRSFLIREVRTYIQKSSTVLSRSV